MQGIKVDLTKSYDVRADLEAMQSLSALLPAETLYPSEVLYANDYDYGKVVDIPVTLAKEVIYNVSI